jgi:predicted RNA binding protein YcfA (HicA-like mRNA interferase family)
MAAKIDVASKGLSCHLVDEASKDQSFDRIERLVEEVFTSIIQKMKVLGLSEAQASEIVFSRKSSIEIQQSFQITSLMTIPGFNSLSVEMSEHLKLLINEHPGNSFFFLYYVFFARVFRQIESMEDLEPRNKAFHQSNKELIFVFWLFFQYLDAKFDVDHLIRHNPSRTLDFIKVLKDSIYFMNEKEFQDNIMRYLERYQSVLQPHHANFILDLRLILALTSHPESIKSIRKCALIKFSECQKPLRSVEDLEPFFDFSSKLLSYLHEEIGKAHAMKSGFSFAKLIVIPECIEHYSKCFYEMKEIASRIKSIHSKDISQIQSFAKRMYHIFVRTVGNIGSENAYAMSHTDQIVSSERIHYDSLRRWMPVAHTCLHFTTFLHNVLHVLDFHHGFEYSGVFRRSQLMCISLGLSNFYDPESMHDPSLAPFKKILEQACNIQFLKLSQEDRKGYTGNLFLGRYDIVNLNLLEKQFNGEVLPADPAAAQEFDPTGMKSERDDQLPIKYWVLLDFYQFFDRDRFVQSLRDLRKELLKAVGSMPKESVTLELQNSLHHALANIFKKQIIECLFYRDLKKLLSEKKSKHEVFPDELLDLIFIDLPGVTEEQIHPKEMEELTSRDMPFSCLEGVDVTIKRAESFTMASSPIKEDDDMVDFEAPKAAAAAAACPSKKESGLKESQAVEFEWSDFKNAKKFRQVCELLKMMNYNILRQNGSHVIFGREEDGEVVVPRHAGDLGTGLLNSIYKQATASKDS